MRERKKYYYEYWPSGLPGEAVAYFRGEHPGYRLRKGEPIDDWVIPCFDIGGFDEATGKRTETGRLTDILHTDVSWFTVNKRTRDLLVEAGIGPRKVQWLDVCLQCHGQEIVGEYFVANILDVRSAVHPIKSKFVGAAKVLTKIVLLQEAIGGAELFRLREAPSHVYFSPRLRDLLDQASVTGVEWNPELVVE